MTPKDRTLRIHAYLQNAERMSVEAVTGRTATDCRAQRTVQCHPAARPAPERGSAR
jgi:hypothetical protein